MHHFIDKKNKIVVYLILLFLLSTTSSKNFFNQENFNIKIDNISVTGLSNNNNSQIIDSLNIFLNKNIFNISKEEINKAVSKYTKFIAKISGNNGILVGSNGKLIIKENSDEILPNIFGEFNSKEFLIFQKKIIESEFNFTDIKSLFFFRSKRWDILTTNDTLIKLPEINLSESLFLAYKIISNDQFKNKKLIDLRINNNLIMQ